MDDEISKIIEHGRSGWREKHPELEACPIRDVVGQISGKWSFLVISTLAQRPYRFGELRREIYDISQRMLTQTLRDLQYEGIIEREVFPTTPPSVEYRLTALGKSLLVPLAALVDWADKNHDAVRAARKQFEANTNEEAA
jgi:DNA-binding HxlR family transcriptional regulator